MSTQLIVFGIQATLRAAQAGADLYRERARDRPVFLPDLEFPTGGKQLQLVTYLRDNPGPAAAEAAFRAIWDADRRLLVEDASGPIDAAYVEMLRLRARDGLAAAGQGGAVDAQRRGAMIAGGRMVEQWRRDREPPSAVARMALTLVDIGLEYVQTDPAILGLSSRGEQLIVAFAGNLTELIPDDVAAFGPRADFADRVLGVFLRAGLGTLSADASLVIRDADAAVLVEAVVGPIVTALPEGITDQLRYREIVDALVGPSAEAAFRLLAKDTERYLGGDFADDEALGAVTAALFEEIAETAGADSLLAVFTEDGAVELYQAALGVAAERPGLFVSGASAEKALLRELFAGTARTLHAHPRFDGPVGASLAAMAIRTTGNHAAALLALDPDAPWEKLAGDLVAQLAKGLGDRVEQGSLARFSDAELIDLGRTVLEQVARTPGMLGADRREVQTIIAGVASTMAADDTLLLGPDEWLLIAATAAETAAANPGRLFGLDGDDPTDALGRTAITAVLRVAGQSWAAAGGRGGATPLAGATLADAISLVVEALAGNVEGAVAEPRIVDDFFTRLLALAEAHPDRFGSRSLLRVVDALIGRVLAEGRLPTDAEIMEAAA